MPLELPEYSDVSSGLISKAFSPESLNRAWETKYQRGCIPAGRKPGLNLRRDAWGPRDEPLPFQVART